VKSPRDRAGVSLHQAVLEWGKHFRVFYELERSGQLVGIHVGNRVWYSRAQLLEVLGEPSLNSVKKRESAKGPQLSFAEFEDAA